MLGESLTFHYGSSTSWERRRQRKDISKERLKWCHWWSQVKFRSLNFYRKEEPEEFESRNAQIQSGRHSFPQSPRLHLNHFRADRVSPSVRSPHLRSGATFSSPGYGHPAALTSSPVSGCASWNALLAYPSPRGPHLLVVVKVQMWRVHFSGLVATWEASGYSQDKANTPYTLHLSFPGSCHSCHPLTSF